MRSILINNSDFVSNQEKKEIVEFVDQLNQQKLSINDHMKSISDKLNGNSFMYDLTNTEISKYLSDFQSIGIPSIKLSIIFLDLKDKISKLLNISDENVFLQILDQKSGGEIPPHYDSSVSGFINYKCNISILSENYKIYIDKDSFNIKEGDLYCFESSLYKHWTNKFTQRRIILSYGFGLKYEDLGRSESDPRIRMSERIQKYFQR